MSENQLYTFEKIEKHCDEGLGLPLKRFDKDTFDYKLAFESIAKDSYQNLIERLKLGDRLLEYVACNFCDEGISVDFDEIKDILKPLKEQCEEDYRTVYNEVTHPFSSGPDIEFLALTGFEDTRDILNLFTEAFKNIRDYGDMDISVQIMIYIGFDFSPYPEVIEIVKDKLKGDELERFNNYMEGNIKGYQNSSQMLLPITGNSNDRIPCLY